MFIEMMCDKQVQPAAAAAAATSVSVADDDTSHPFSDADTSVVPSHQVFLHKSVVFYLHYF